MQIEVKIYGEDKKAILDQLKNVRDKVREYLKEFPDGPPLEVNFQDADSSGSYWAELTN